MSLKNKVAIVTGASSGIGAAIAIKLTEEGAQTVIVGRNEVKLNKTSGICEARGLKPLTIIADVTIDDDLKNIIAKTITSFGELNILVNNAGIPDRHFITDKRYMPIFDKVMFTNFRSAVYFTHLAAEHLSMTKGNIVNIGSIYSHDYCIPKNASAYTASKVGLNQFTKCVAKDFAAKGVRVNIICPGTVKCDMMVERLTGKPATESDWDRLRATTPLKRISETEEIADLVAYISSDKGRSFTGSSIVIDNGMLVEFYLKSSKK